jgi:hypothetical protein
MAEEGAPHRSEHTSDRGGTDLNDNKGQAKKKQAQREKILIAIGAVSLIIIYMMLRSGSNSSSSNAANQAAQQEQEQDALAQYEAQLASQYGDLGAGSTASDADTLQDPNLASILQIIQALDGEGSGTNSGGTSAGTGSSLTSQLTPLTDQFVPKGAAGYSLGTGPGYGSGFVQAISGDIYGTIGTLGGAQELEEQGTPVYIEETPGEFTSLSSLASLNQFESAHPGTTTFQLVQQASGSNST